MSFLYYQVFKNKHPLDKKYPIRQRVIVHDWFISRGFNNLNRLRTNISNDIFTRKMAVASTSKLYFICNLEQKKIIPHDIFKFQ